MIADVISQLERREGMLPLSVEDRPRLSALIAAQPELLAAIREAHALASRHFPAGSEVQVVIVDDPDDPAGGPYVTAAIWVDDDWTHVRSRKAAMVAEWLQRTGSTGRMPVLLTVRYGRR